MILKDGYGIEELWDVLYVTKKLNTAIDLMYQLDDNVLATMEGAPDRSDYISMGEKMEKVRSWISETYFNYDFIAKQIEKELEREERNAE